MRSVLDWAFYAGHDRRGHEQAAKRGQAWRERVHPAEEAPAGRQWPHRPDPPALAAVNLRGSIEPADYKRFVLPIVFLRFLSLRYERRRHELERMVKEPGSEYYTKNAKQAAAILEDPDEYRSVGPFILPKPARWDEIVKHARYRHPVSKPIRRFQGWVLGLVTDVHGIELDRSLEEVVLRDRPRAFLARQYPGLPSTVAKVGAR